MRALPLALLTLAACKKKEEPGANAAVAEPASLTVEHPAEAAWLPAGATAVSGQASGVEVVRANGQDLAMDGEKFSGTVQLQRGINLVEVEAAEPDGDLLFERRGVLAGEFADPGHPVQDAMALRINRGGLDQLTELALGMIDATSISATVQKSNPILELDYGFGTWANADLEALYFDQPQITINPTSGALELEVALPNLQVDLYAWGEAAWFDVTQAMQMTSTEAVITAELAVAAEDGTLTADLINPTVTLNGFAYDTELLPEWIESYVFVDTIQTKIEETLIGQMQEMVPAILDDTLAGLDPSFTTELLGKELSLAAQFASVNVDSDGLQIGLDLDVDVPGQGSMAYQGYLTANAGSPDVDRDAEMAMAIYDDLLNRLLFEAWRGGMLEMTLSTADGSLEPAMLSMLHAEEGSITVSAALPPVIVEKDGGLEAQVGELSILIHTPGGEFGENLLLSVNANVGVELGLESNLLTLDLGTPDLTLTVRESDWGASNESITNLVEEMLPVELLLAFLGALEFELPSLYGMTFESADVSRDATGFHTGVTVDLGVE